MKKYINVIIALLLLGSTLTAAELLTRVGVMTPFTNNDDTELATEAVDAMKHVLHELKRYDVYDEKRMTRDFAAFNKEFPQYCHEPRCASELGVMLQLDKMMYGKVIKGDDQYAFELTFVDALTQSVVEDVSIEGEKGEALELVVKKGVLLALDRMTSDEKREVKRYFGEQVDNKKQFMLSSASYMGAALLYSIIAHDPQDGSMDLSDMDMSGIDPSMRTIASTARAKAMGNCYVAASKDAYGVFYNPAGAAWVDGPEMTLNYQKTFKLVPGITASYVNKATREIGWGHGLQVYSDSLYQELYFNTNVAYRFANVGKLPPFSIGGNLHFASQRTMGGVGLDKQEGTGFGFGLDFGALIELNNKIDFGFVLNNIMSPNFYSNSKRGVDYVEFNVPEFKLGGTYEVRYGTLLIAEGRIPFMRNIMEDQNWELHGGVEQRLFSYVLTRMGAYKEMFEERDMPWHMTFGLGIDAPIKEKHLTFDISYDVNTKDPLNVWDFSARFDI